MVQGRLRTQRAASAALTRSVSGSAPSALLVRSCAAKPVASRIGVCSMPLADDLAGNLSPAPDGKWRAWSFRGGYGVRNW